MKDEVKAKLGSACRCLSLSRLGAKLSFTRSVLYTLTIAIATGACGTSEKSHWSNGKWQPPQRDVLLSAGRKGASYAELVRVQPDGTCELRFYQASSDVAPDGYFRTSAKVGEQIDGGDSDYYGKVVSADPQHQTAVIREYKLGPH